MSLPPVCPQHCVARAQPNEERPAVLARLLGRTDLPVQLVLKREPILSQTLARVIEHRTSARRDLRVIEQAREPQLAVGMRLRALA